MKIAFVHILAVTACLILFSCNKAEEVQDIEPVTVLEEGTFDSIYYNNIQSITITSLHHFETVPSPTGGSYQRAMPIDTIAFLEIDVDNDGVNDFYCETKAYYEFHSASTPQANLFHTVAVTAINQSDSLIGVGFDNGNHNATLNWWESIDNTQRYTTGIPCYTIAWGIGLIGTQEGTHYYGFKLYRNNQPHYGWLKIDHTPYTLTVQSFAFNETPGNPINAGQQE
jgi:hypothetical protein